MAKADIDFEIELWDAANELRGAVTENKYKNYILPFVFVKHLRERYKGVREELKEQLNEKDIVIYGQEMTAQTLRLCLMNLMLRDLSFDIKTLYVDANLLAPFKRHRNCRNCKIN